MVLHSQIDQISVLFEQNAVGENLLHEVPFKMVSFRKELGTVVVACSHDSPRRFPHDDAYQGVSLGKARNVNRIYRLLGSPGFRLAAGWPKIRSLCRDLGKGAPRDLNPLHGGFPASVHLGRLGQVGPQSACVHVHKRRDCDGENDSQTKETFVQGQQGPLAPWRLAPGPDPARFLRMESGARLASVGPDRRGP